MKTHIKEAIIIVPALPTLAIEPEMVGNDELGQLDHNVVVKVRYTYIEPRNAKFQYESVETMKVAAQCHCFTAESVTEAA